MKILHVIGAMDRGGAETMIMNLMRRIDRSQFQFDFLVHEYRECDYDMEIRQLGGIIYHIPRYNVVNRKAYKKALKAFFEQHHNYDIVHGHISSSINLYSKEAKKYRIKTIAHSHAANYGFSLESIYTVMVSFWTRSIADYFIGCSLQAGKDRYGKKVIKSNNFTILPNGIDTSLYLCTSNKVHQPLVFGHVGRLTKAKNHTFLIDVFNEIKKSRPEARLMLLGKGELETSIRKKVMSYGLEESVDFIGTVPDVWTYLNKMDVFIFPSLYEGLGIAYVEAQASGLPCVISDTIPLDGQVGEGTVRLSLKDSPTLWANKCLESVGILNRQSRNQELSESSFNIDLSVKELEKIYQNLKSGK